MSILAKHLEEIMDRIIDLESFGNVVNIITKFEAPETKQTE